MLAFRPPSFGSNLLVHDLPGAEPPIVFLHGLGCTSSTDYPRVIRDPALNGKRAILVDLPGHGFSDRPLDFDYTIDNHAAVVCELADMLALDEFDLFGHSMGGSIAISAAERLGNRVRRLAVSEPNLDAGGGIFSRTIAEQTEDGYVENGHQALTRSVRINGSPVEGASMQSCSPIAVYRSAKSLVLGTNPTWREILNSLSVPRTVIFGERSLPDADSERLPAAGVRVDFVPDAGHSMALENPVGLAGAIARSIA